MHSTLKHSVTGTYELVNDNIYVVEFDCKDMGAKFAEGELLKSVRINGMTTVEYSAKGQYYLDSVEFFDLPDEDGEETPEVIFGNDTGKWTRKDETYAYLAHGWYFASGKETWFQGGPTSVTAENGFLVITGADTEGARAWSGSSTGMEIPTANVDTVRIRLNVSEDTAVMKLGVGYISKADGSTKHYYSPDIAYETDDDGWAVVTYDISASPYKTEDYALTRVCVYPLGQQTEAAAAGTAYIDYVELLNKEEVKDPSTENALKILAIGNSYSVDSMEYLWNICNSAGVNVVLGNLNIGGASLDLHWSNISSAAENYVYSKNTNGAWTEQGNYNIQDGIADEDWDIITIQQASYASGLENTYTYLANILNHLEEAKPSEETKILWNMTWAYQGDYESDAFASNYQSNQETMYTSIVTTVQNTVATKEAIDGIIPTGTAIQNLRGHIGDTISRDGIHLGYDYGRYTAALTWYCYITGNAPDTVTWVPAAYPAVSEKLTEIRTSVADAISSPYSVTTE